MKWSINLIIFSFFASLATASDYNVLFISADDLNTDLGCYGSEHVKTPNLDKLASMGVRFDRAYCQAAVCGASRQSVLFGLRPNTTGVTRMLGSARKKNPDAVALPQLFRKNGIYSARVGKVFHYSNPGAIGTDGHDDPESWDERFNPAGIDKKRENEIWKSNGKEWVKAKGRLGASHTWWDPESKDNEHTDGMVAEKTVELIEQHKDERFFIAAGFFRPHCPYVAPKHYFDRYPLEQVEVPDLKTELEDRNDVPPLALGQTHHDIKDMPIEHIRRLRQAYFASITFLDAQVGLMLDALEDNGLMDKTIIVFWSDHGYFIGEKALWYKFKNYETAFRSPLIIAAPGMAPGDCERVVELLDIYPTVTDLAGLTPQSKLEGASLRPLMENPKAAWARPAIGQNNVGYSIRTEQYRFTRYGESLDQWELYDHTNDPEERANLIRQNKSLEIAKQLNETLKPYRGSKSGKKKK